MKRAAAAYAVSAVVGLGFAAAGAPDVLAAPRVWRAEPGRAAAALAAAVTGDTVILLPGRHGPLVIARSVVLRGEPGAILDGGGRGTALVVTASGAVIADLEVRGSGNRVLTIDGGIRISGAGVTVRRVRIRDVLYGIVAERAAGLVVADCDLEGRVAPLEEDGSGNGIHLWYCDGPRIERNHVTHFADAVYLSFVNRAVVEGCRLEGNGRYGLHTMYCQDNRLLGNLFTHNVAGCAIMFSNHLEVRGNDFFRNRGPRTYGLLLRDCSAGRFENNRLVENTVAIFMDNSNRNHLSGNLIQDNGWGVLMFASCAGNEVAGNSFLNNDYPVALDMRRSSNRFDDGQDGNYWSEHAAWDLDGDGRGDVAFAPVSAFAFLSKQFPDLAVLAKSPAVAALGVAERVLPALRPSEVVDRYPRLAPARATGTGAPLGRAERAEAQPWAALGFSVLATLGLAGLVRGGARR